MKNVRDVLGSKGSEIWSIRPDESVYQALELMAAKQVGALLVLHEGQVVGIFSERDYARKVILKGKASKQLPVSKIMSTQVFWVSPARTIEEAMALMTDKHIRHLPVLEDNELIGFISIGDVVKALIEEREFVIGQLENYIRGAY
jgi:CBS domain-containing protein